MLDHLLCCVFRLALLVCTVYLKRTAKQSIGQGLSDFYERPSLFIDPHDYLMRHKCIAVSYSRRTAELDLVVWQIIEHFHQNDIAQLLATHACCCSPAKARVGNIACDHSKVAVPAVLYRLDCALAHGCRELDIGVAGNRVHVWRLNAQIIQDVPRVCPSTTTRFDNAQFWCSGGRQCRRTAKVSQNPSRDSIRVPRLQNNTAPRPETVAGLHAGLTQWDARQIFRLV